VFVEEEGRGRGKGGEKEGRRGGPREKETRSVNEGEWIWRTGGGEERGRRGGRRRERKGGRNARGLAGGGREGEISHVSL